MVVGGGDSATLDALFLASTASSVMLAHRSPELTARHDIVAQLRAEKRIEDLPGWEVESVGGAQRLESVTDTPCDRRAENGRQPAGWWSRSLGILPPSCTAGNWTWIAGGSSSPIASCAHLVRACSPLATWSAEPTGACPMPWGTVPLCRERSSATSRMEPGAIRAAEQRAFRQGRHMSRHLALPPAADIVAQMERAVTGDGKPAALAWATDELGWTTLILELVDSNLRQWDLEDTTRDPGAERHKSRRRQARDRPAQPGASSLWWRRSTPPSTPRSSQPATAPIATESPGMVLDRLSVLVIRRARTAAASSRDPGFADRTVALESQVVALSLALDSYMDELRAGTRRFLRYESFKLYGPSAAAAG